MHTHYTLLHCHRYALDNALPLVGDNSVLGRSIVIHKANGDRWVCATILNNPTYTYLPPPPPPPSPPPSTETVVLTMTASGSISDYSDTSSLQQKVATAAGVDTSLVAISVAPGSVIITATIAVPASATAATVQSSLYSTMGTAADASAVLGITVESDPTITTESTIASEDSPSDLALPIIIVIVAGSFALVACFTSFVCLVMHKRQQQNKPGRVKRGETPDPEAGYQMNVKDQADLQINEA